MKILKAISLLVVALMLLVVGLFGFLLYKKRPLQTFCKNLPPSATAKSIVEDAQKQGFIVLGEVSDNASIRVLNHRSFFFRSSCDVKFKNGRMESRSVSAAD